MPKPLCAIRKCLMSTLLWLVLLSPSEAQPTAVDSLKEEVNRQYSALLPKLKQALALGNINGSLAIARQIEAIARPVFGDTSRAMANIWHAIYSPIYVNLRNYRMVYLVNDSARRVLLALGDTLHPHYLGSLKELSSVCEKLNPTLPEEGLAYAEQLSNLLSYGVDPLAKADGLVAVSKKAFSAGKLSVARKALLQAGTILDTLKPYGTDSSYVKADSAQIIRQRVVYQSALAIFLAQTGQTDDALRINEKALQEGSRLKFANRMVWYEGMINRAAIFLLLGQYDSAQVWIHKVVKRKELQHFAEITRQAKVLEGLAELGKQSGISRRGIDTDFNSLTSGLEGLNQEAMSLKIIQLFGNLQQGDTTSFTNDLRLIKQAVQKDKLSNAFFESVIKLLEALAVEKSSSAGNGFDETVRISGDYFRSLLSQLPTLSESQQRQALNLLPFFMDLPYGKLDGAVSQKSLHELLYLHWQRKALVLNQWQGFRQKQKADSLLTSLTNHWQQIRSAYVRSVSLGFSQPLMDSLKGQVALLEAAIAEQMPLQVLSPDSMQALLNKLPKTAALVDFVRVQFKIAGGQDSVVYKAFVVNGQTKQVQVVNIGSEMELVLLFYDSNKEPFSSFQLVKALYSEGQATAQKAYQWLWKPIEKYLQGTQEIYLSKAGILHQVAFGALANGKARLLRRYSFYEGLHVPSMLMLAHQKPAIHEAQVWGAIDYGKAIARTGSESIAFIPTTLRPGEQLLQASDEPLANLDAFPMEPIAAILRTQGVKVDLYNGNRATESRFKAIAASANGILHINTHGFYKPPTKGKGLIGPSQQTDPLLNFGLALAGANQYWLTGTLLPDEEEDGLLTAYEIAQLDLSGLKLATLSACETALGQPTGGEGTLGLVRGLRIAGVPRVLASLWPVPAKATQELMLAFYKQWGLEPNPAKALRQAQLALLTKGYPPFYWAGWVLVE